MEVPVDDFYLTFSEAGEVIEHHPSVETLAQWTRIACFTLRLLCPAVKGSLFKVSFQCFLNVKVGDSFAAKTCVFWAFSYNGEISRVLLPNIVFPPDRQNFSAIKELVVEKVGKFSLREKRIGGWKDPKFSPRVKHRSVKRCEIFSD